MHPTPSSCRTASRSRSTHRFSMEYEGVPAQPFSLGLTGSYVSIDNTTYSTIEAKGRLYPNEEAPKGFSIGLALGLTHLTEDNACDIGCNSNRSTTRPTIGVAIEDSPCLTLSALPRRAL